ncbi:MAG: branched-chain amino acid ABC transporter permease [Rhodospirillales bacterium]|nr:branched-chain amino acid ABC transporter permease [Rhodospirillales bacterium]
MRFQFKTSYNQDIRLFKDKVDAGWYGLLAMAVVALPMLMSDYYVGEATWVFIYAICGVSLMVLVGYTGLVSLGHAAFLGIGAYAHAFFLKHGMPWIPSVVLAVAITTASGIVVGLPALRMTGIYLAIATLAFSVIIQEVFSRWESVTHGFAGMPVEKPVIFGVPFQEEGAFYYLCLFFLVVVLWLTRNLLRSPTGRAWIAIRDSEIAAQSMGVNLAIYKSIAFAYSAALMGLAGALFAHKIAYLAPDIFTILLSIQFLLLVIVGGLGSLHGAVFGAIFVALLPPLIAILRDSIPATMNDAAAAMNIKLLALIGDGVGNFLKKPGVEAGIFGLILVLMILLEPLGMYGRWVKIRVFFSTFPMYRGATFKRQKSYMRSERLR